MFKATITETWKANNEPFTKIEEIRAKQKVSGYSLNDMMDGVSRLRMCIENYAIIRVENDKVDDGEYTCMVAEAVVNGEEVTFSTSSAPFISALCDMCADVTGDTTEYIEIEVDSVRSKNYSGNFYKPSIVDIK